MKYTVNSIQNKVYRILCIVYSLRNFPRQIISDFFHKEKAIEGFEIQTLNIELMLNRWFWFSN